MSGNLSDADAFQFYQKKSNACVFLCDSPSATPHKHEFIEIVYVTSGTAIHVLNGTKRTIRKGDYFIMDYNSKHSYAKTGSTPFAIINCLFYPELIDKTLKNCRNLTDILNSYLIFSGISSAKVNPVDMVFDDSDGCIGSIVRRMLDEYSKKYAGYEKMIRCLLIEFIILTMRRINDAQTSEYGSLEQYVTDCIEKHFSEKITLEAISRELNFSTSYLSNKFRTTVGINFETYLQQRRITEACRLLISGNKKIPEIAAFVGYSDTKYFYTLFKRHKGMTPLEFRKKYT